MTSSLMSVTDRKRASRRKQRREDKQSTRLLAAQQIEEAAIDQEERNVESRRRMYIASGANPDTGVQYASIEEFHDEVEKLVPLTYEESVIAMSTYFLMDYARDTMEELYGENFLSRPAPASVSV